MNWGGIEAVLGQFGRPGVMTWPAATISRENASTRSRTEMTLRSGDFHPTTVFTASLTLFVVWTVPSPSSEDIRCAPSSLYTFQLSLAWFGISTMYEHQSLPRL